MRAAPPLREQPRRADRRAPSEAATPPTSRANADATGTARQRYFSRTALTREFSRLYVTSVPTRVYSMNNEPRGRDLPWPCAQIIMWHGFHSSLCVRLDPLSLLALFAHHARFSTGWRPSCHPPRHGQGNQPCIQSAASSFQRAAAAPHVCPSPLVLDQATSSHTLLLLVARGSRSACTRFGR